MPVTLSEEVVSALIVALLRRGVLTPDDLLSVENVEPEAREHIEALIVEAAAPPASEWAAERHRARLRIVDPK